MPGAFLIPRNFPGLFFTLITVCLVFSTSGTVATWEQVLLYLLLKGCPRVSRGCLDSRGESTLDEVGLGMHAQVFHLLACSGGTVTRASPWGETAFLTVGCRDLE